MRKFGSALGDGSAGDRCVGLMWLVAVKAEIHTQTAEVGGASMLAWVNRGSECIAQCRQVGREEGQNKCALSNGRRHTNTS